MYVLPNLKDVKKVVITADVIDKNQQPILLQADGQVYQADNGQLDLHKS